MLNDYGSYKTSMPTTVGSQNIVDLLPVHLLFILYLSNRALPLLLLFSTEALFPPKLYAESYRMLKY
jgi:hypothetical protein